MEYGSLGDLLKNNTFAFDGELILPILCDITQGLRFLHSADPQVIHGDLKARNVLVDSKFRAKVADFGLSQKKKIGATGTPFYMSPVSVLFGTVLLVQGVVLAKAVGVLSEHLKVGGSYGAKYRNLAAMGCYR